MLPGKLSCHVPVRAMISTHAFDGVRRLVRRREGDETLTSREEVGDPRFLHDRRTSGREVADRTIGDPPAPAFDIGVLGRAELSAGPLQVRHVAAEGAANAGAAGHAPATFDEPSAVVFRHVVRREFKRQGRVFRKINEPCKLHALLSVGLARVGHGTIGAPVGDRCQRRVRRRRTMGRVANVRFPKLRNNRGHEGIPLEAERRDHTAGLANIGTVAE